MQRFYAGDGANSNVRRQLGIELEGESELQNLINIHFTSRELGSALLANPGMLYFVFNPSVVAVLVAHDLERGM